MSPAPRNEMMPNRIELPRNDQTLLSTLIFNPARWLGNRAMDVAEWTVNKVWNFVTHPLVLIPALTAGGIVLGRNRQLFGTDPNNLGNRAADAIEGGAGWLGQRAVDGAGVAGQTLSQGYDWVHQQASPLVGQASQGANNFLTYMRDWVTGADLRRP